MNQDLYEPTEEEIEQAMNDHYGGGDCLSAICSRCGEPAEWPDCGNCGQMLGEPVEQPEGEMVSGMGQYHTNEANPANPRRTLTPYLAIGLRGIRALVDTPQEVEKKAEGQWLIPSTLPRRCKVAQEADGAYLMLWGDIDEHCPIDPILES